MISAHLAHNHETTPKESIHALTADELRGSDIRFWAVFVDDVPLGCGALKALEDGTAEVKSVHVVATARRRGLARRIMVFLAAEARSAGHKALVLETGSALLPEFDAARALYARLGYQTCDSIPGYGPDPNSTFLRLELDPR